MNEISQFKEQVVNNYISSSVDLDDLEKVDADKMKEELKALLQETPGVEFIYEAEVPLLEDGSRGKRSKRLKSISVAYTFEEDGQIRFKKLNYVVG